MLYFSRLIHENEIYLIVYDNCTEDKITFIEGRNIKMWHGKLSETWAFYSAVLCF